MTFILSTEAIISDLDNTLVQTNQALAHACFASDSIAGFMRYPVPETVPRYTRMLFDSQKEYVGENYRLFALNAYPDTHHHRQDGYTADEVWGVTSWIYKATLEQFTAPIPRISLVLEILCQRNIPVAVLSNAPLDAVLQHLHLTGLARYFDPSLVFGGTERLRKPADEAYLQVVRALGVQRKRVAMVDDHGGNVDAAARLGLQPLWANYSDARYGLDSPLTPTWPFLELRQVEDLLTLPLH